MRIQKILTPLISVVALATAACTAPAGVSGSEKMETIEIDLYGAHIHGLHISKITIRGEVPEASGFVEMSAALDEGTITRMTVATQPGRKYVVPQSFFSGIENVQEQSFQIANGVTSPPRKVAGVVIWVDYGNPEARKDLNCEGPSTEDPRYRTLEISFNAETHKFSRVLKDACGRDLP